MTTSQNIDPYDVTLLNRVDFPQEIYTFILFKLKSSIVMVTISALFSCKPWVPLRQYDQF